MVSEGLGTALKLQNSNRIDIAIDCGHITLLYIEETCVLLLINARRELMQWILFRRVSCPSFEVIQECSHFCFFRRCDFGNEYDLLRRTSTEDLSQR